MFAAYHTDVALIGQRMGNQLRIELDLLHAALSEWQRLSESPFYDVDLRSSQCERGERFGRFVVWVGRKR